MRKLIAAIAMSIVLIGTLAPVAFSLNKKPTLPVGNFSEVSLTMEIQKAFAIAPNSDGTCPADYPVKDPQTGDCVAASVNNNAGGSTIADFDCGNFDFACKITTFVIDLITFVPNFIAVLLGALSDVFLKLSISPGMYGATAGGSIDSGIRDAWKIVRDFSNIGFIFALFVAAFMLILDKTSVGGTQFEPKKVVVRVIIMALLVNFSLLFCRLTIQTADIFSNLLYSKLGSYDYSSSSNGTAATVGNLFNDTLHMKSVSLPLISLSSPQELFLNAGITPQTSGRNAAYLVVGFAIFFVLLLLIWTFASMMFIFLGRILGLWLGIILSPLAFVSFAIPFLEKNEFIGFDSWLKNFFELAFMTPVYLFFMYITISILNIKGIGEGMMGSVPDDSAWLVLVLKAVVSTMIPLLMSCFLLLQGKKIAVKMSGQIGELVSGATGMVTGMAMGAATGGAAFLGRQTAGRLGAGLASATADSPRLSGLNTIGKSLSTSTFDVRNNKFAMDKFGKVTGAMGEKVELGTENLQEKGGYGATGGVRQVLQDRKDRIADEKATAAEKEALERANNPQSRENIQKRNTERQIAANAKAKENEESRIALEAENAIIDTSEEEKTITSNIADADTAINDNNARMAQIDADLATKKPLTEQDLIDNANVQTAAEAIVKSIETKEAEVNAKLAANAAKKIPEGMGVTQTTKDQAAVAIAKEKADLEAEAATLHQEKTNQQAIVAEAKEKAKGNEEIKTLETEKTNLVKVNQEKEVEKTKLQEKLANVKSLQGKTVAQVRDEAAIEKAKAESSPEKIAADKAKKDADEQAVKVAELETQIKKAEKEKDTKLAERLKEELNGGKWEEIEGMEAELKKAREKKDKGKIAELNRDIKAAMGGTRKKLDDKRGDEKDAKTKYDIKYGNNLKNMDDTAKNAEKKYKKDQEDSGRLDVYAKRAADLNIQLAKDTVALANRRKEILGAHAKSLDGKNSLLKGVGVNIDKYATPMQNALNKTADFTVNRVLPNALKINANKKFGTTNLAEIIGVVSGGRVAGGSVGNATEAAATAVRNQIRQ